MQLSTTSKAAAANNNNSNGSAGGEGPALTMVIGRVEQLEREMKQNSAKLDRILELLESKKDR